MTNAKKLDKMTESELADFYQEHKGDLSLWQKTPRPMRRRRGDGPSTSFAIRITPAEIEELQAAAALSETTLSDFIRSAALTAAREAQTPDSNDATRLKFKTLSRQLKKLKESLEETEKELRRAV